MKTWAHSATLATLLVAVVVPNVISRATAGDLRDAVPPDMFLAVHGRHNPERDYQKQYYKEVWEAVEKSRLPGRLMQIIQSRVDGDDVGKMLAFRDSVKEALEPVEWEKLLGCTEVVYAQKLEGTATQNILIIRCPDNSAASLKEGIGNLFRMADEAAGNNISLHEEAVAGAELLNLQLPPQVPFSPVIGVREDLFIFSTNPQLAKQCLSLLDDPAAESKFDDPRVKEALAHLPEPEDALVFFDGRALSQQLKGIVSFIQGVGARNEKALRVAGLIDRMLKEIDVVDYEVTSEYTDGNRNQTTSFGKSVRGYESTLLGKMVAGQRTFSNWSQWVPASASSFSLQSGVNLHPLYEWMTTKIPEMFPESKEAFYKFDQIQDEYDLHLDADLLQSFSGESVSINLPGPATPFGKASRSVTFLRCENPERIRELIHRGFAELQKIPQVRAQGVTMTESDSLEGFEEINAAAFAMLGGLTPVFGVRDGWMAIGSHTDAVEAILLTKGGESKSFATTDRFTQFGLDVKGDVQAISYSNTGEKIREMATGLQQVGSMVPLFMAMAGQGGDAANLQPVQDFLGLLPSVGRVIGKFDFIESTLSVTQPGPTDGTYFRHTVTMIRAPEPVSAAAE